MFKDIYLLPYKNLKLKFDICNDFKMKETVHILHFIFPLFHVQIFLIGDDRCLNIKLIYSSNKPNCLEMKKFSYQDTGLLIHWCIVFSILYPVPGLQVAYLFIMFSVLSLVLKE